jgi:hypothetical protein
MLRDRAADPHKKRTQDAQKKKADRLAVICLSTP